jgi:hypothetical protein
MSHFLLLLLYHAPLGSLAVGLGDDLVPTVHRVV